MRDRRQAKGFFWGAVLVAVGGWFLLSSLGVELPGMHQLWPVFPLLSGLGSLLGFFTRTKKDAGLVFSGTLLSLLGLFFFCFTFEVLYWEDMEVWWPVFPLIAGIAFVFSWLAGRCRELRPLVPGVLSLAVGVIGLFFTLGEMSVEGVRLAGSLLVVALGVAIVLGSFRRTTH